MGTIIANKEKTDAFNVIRFYNHKNLWDASNCACCKQLMRGEMSKTTATRLQCDIATFKSTNFSYF